MGITLDLSMAPKAEEAKFETGITLDLSVAPKKQAPVLDLSAAEPEEEQGVLGAAGHGLAHGTLGLGEAAGSGMEYLGNRMIQTPREMPADLSLAWKQLTPGQRDETVMRMNELEEGGTPHPEAYRQALEDQYGARITQGPGAELGRKMVETGQRTVKYFNEWAQEYAPDKSLQGSILEKPELMLKASWWAYNVGDMVPSLAASLLPAAGTAKTIQIGGRMLQWSPAIIQRVAMLGGAVAGGISGGALEGSHTYQEVMRNGGSEEEAARAAELMALFSAGLNSLSTGRMLSGAGKGIKGKIANYLKSGATEGTTEWLEEGADALARDLGKYLSGEEMPDGTFGRIVESLRNGFNIFPIAFVTGAGGSMVAGGAMEGEAEAESSAVPAQEQASEKVVVESVAQSEDVAQAETPAAEDIPVFTREDARQSLEENLGEAEAGAVLDLWDMRAEAWAEQTGKSPEQWYESTLADIWKGDEAQFMGRDNLLYQGREQDKAQAVMDWLKPFQDGADSFNQTRAGVNAAAVEFLEDARGIIRLFGSGDVPAIIHETGHILRRQLPETDLAVVESHFNVQNGIWSREAEEAFADTFERYVYEQKAPTMRLRLVLNKLRYWLVKLYGNIRNLRGGEIHDDVRQVFDRLMTTEQARQAEKDPASPASSFKVNAELYGVENVVEPADVAAMKSFDDVEAEAQRRAFAHADKEKRKLERSLVAEWRKEAHEVAGEMRLFRVLSDYTGVLDRGTKDQRSKPGIDIHLIRQDFGEDTTKEILKRRPGLLRSTGGAAYDTVASAYGYNDGEEMIRDLVEGPRKGEFIDDYIQERLDHHEQLKALDDDYGQEYAAIQNHALEILAKLTKRQTEKIKTAKIREEVGSRRIMNLGKTRFAMRRERESLYNRSRAAFNNGHPDQAHLLLNQMHNLDMQLREVERAIAERDRIQNSIKYNLNRRIPHEYKEQLRAFVARFGLARPGTQPRESTIEFLTMKGVSQWMDMDAVRYLHKVAPGALTVDQLKQVDTVVKTLVHWGDHEGKLLAGEEMREYQTVLEDVCLSVIQSRKKRGGVPDPRFPEPPSARRKSPFARFLRGVDSLHGNLLKPEFIFRSLDGFKEFGTVWSEMFQPLKKAEDRELELGGEIFAKLEAAFKPFQKQFGRWGKDRLDIKYTVKEYDSATGKHFEVEQTLPQKLTREEIIMVALNSGNPGNRNALYKGYKWDKKQLRGILSQLTKEEWKLVNMVWRTIDTIYPHLNEMHMKLKGVPLGKVKGAYFPLMFDRELSWKADKFAEMAAQRDLFQGIYSKPKPNDPMIKDRKGGTMPPLLSFRVLTRHVTDGVHLATHGVAIRDVQKLMTDPNFRQAVEQTWGEGRYRNISPWLQNIARPNREPMTIFEKWANRLRMNTTVVALGLKVSVAMKQFLSFTQTIDELGFTDAMKGIGVYIQNPWKAQEFVNARSLAMRNRRKRWDREVQAMYGQFNPTAFKGKQAVRDAFFWMIGLVDAVATYPTWLSAYEKGMQKNNWDETKAVEYADMVVRRTQPVSAAKDLADIQRGGAFKKLGTMFYTFFSVFTNRMSEVNSRMRHDPNYSAKDAFKSTMWLLVIPAILGDSISKRELPEDKWDYAKSIVGYGLAGVPFIRDITSPILSGFDYTFSPVQDALEAPSDLFNAFSTKKDKGRKITKHSIMAAGYLWGLPSRQVAITVDGALDLVQGKTNDPSRLLFPEKWEDRKSNRKHYTFPRR